MRAGTGLATSAESASVMATRSHKIVIGVMGPAACDPATAALALAVYVSLGPKLSVYGHRTIPLPTLLGHNAGSG